MLLTVLVGCRTPKEPLPYYNTPDFTPVFIRDSRVVTDNITHTIPDFSCTDQEGKTITGKDIEGKIQVADFIFTSCGNICPVLTSHLKKVSKHYQNDTSVLLLSFSVTPWIDSVPRLKAYKEHNGITSKQWHFLTGSRSAIYHLARTGYFAEEDLGFTKDSTAFLHTEHILLIDKTRRIRGIYNGTLQLDIDQLIEDIRVLSEE